MDKVQTRYEKGDEVFILSLNTKAIVVSCVTVGDDEYYETKETGKMLVSADDMYRPYKEITSKYELVEELKRIKQLNMPEDLEQKMKELALLYYISDSEVEDTFYN